MSYIDINDYNFEEDLNKRKEFIQYEFKNSGLKKYELDDMIKKNNMLILNNYQKFITNFINPNTKYDKLLLIHSTGVGKTITSLSTAINFIDIFKKEKELNLVNKQSIGGMVYIIGFTKNVFKKELFSRAEFGIVNREEIAELDQLKKDIIKYNYDKDIARLKELKSRYSSRLKSKKGNGFFEFIGYKELVNKLIIKNQLEYDVQLGNIKSELELNYLLEQGIIKLNYDFLDKFHKSLIICDEIHNVYNSLDTNNWGLCLNIILDYYKEKKMIRVLFLSATPINNKPIEIISLLKLLNNNLEIKKSDIFDSNNNIKKNGYQLIKKYTIGKISFLKDMDLESYPSKEIYGEIISNIPYLKFIKCPMTDLHFKTYEYESNNYINRKSELNTIKKGKADEIDINETDETDETDIDETDETDIDETEINNSYKINNSDEINNEIISIIDGLIKYPINLELENRYLNDIVFPNPNNKIGLYLKNDIIKEINNASTEWKDKYDIQLITNNKLLKNTISGNILLEENIKKYSNKYFKMIQIIKDIIINDKGKIFIYHNFVQVSGINLISEILKINGILDSTETPTKYSKCNICYKIKDLHKNINTHEFQPIRFIMINSMINKNIIDKELDNFNLSNNINGEEIRIILGSKAIKESYNLKEIQNLLVLHQPDNISTLIQIFGRAIRKNSHINLPIDKRKVNIYILISTIPDYIQQKSKTYIYSYEEMKYKYKLQIYQIIKKITNIFIENAIDRNINYNINFPEYQYINANTNDLYYLDKLNKNKLIKIDYNNIKLSTFQSYYYQDEINYCKYLIKILFIEYSRVWKYNDLIKYIRNPYFKTNKNTNYISEYSIIIALDFLLFEKNNINFIHSQSNKKDLSNSLNDSIIQNSISNILIDNLYNSNEKYIIDLDNYYQKNMNNPTKKRKIKRLEIPLNVDINEFYKTHNIIGKNGVKNFMLLFSKKNENMNYCNILNKNHYIIHTNGTCMRIFY